MTHAYWCSKSLTHFPISRTLTHTHTHTCTHTRTHTHAAKCIDHYTKLRVKQFEEGSSSMEEEEEEEEEGGKDEGEQETKVEVIDSRLEDIVNRMFERCLADRRYKQAIGIAFETRRVDILQRAIHESVSVVSFSFTTVLLHSYYKQ